jgi:hypothetical protein
MPDESQHGFGWIPSPRDDRDFLIDQLYALLGFVPVAAPLTYRVPGTLPPVLNQGSTPQCVAYSSAGLKGYEDRIDQGQFFDFDKARFFAAIGGGPNGAFVRNAFRQMLSIGYPEQGGGNAGIHRIAAYYAIPVTQAAIQAAIMAFGPIIIGLSWYNSMFRPNPSGVLNVDPASGLAGGHAIEAIGWDERGLRLRNSWGSSWGLSGECYLPWANLSIVGEAWKAVDVIENTPSRSAMSYQTLPGNPQRVLDTRIGLGLLGVFVAGVPRKVKIAGVGSIPTADVVALNGNLTVTKQTAAGFLAAGPDPTPTPGWSNLNFPPTGDHANALAGVAVNADGTLAITLIGPPNSTAHVVMDVNGVHTP